MNGLKNPGFSQSLLKYEQTLTTIVTYVHNHSRSQQRTDQRVLVLTLNFLALKNCFSPVKSTSQSFFDFCLPLFYATFQCGPYNIFKKISNLFFAHENLKKNGP